MIRRPVAVSATCEYLVSVACGGTASSRDAGPAAKEAQQQGGVEVEPCGPVRASRR